jgi:hypothetical protein
MSRHGGIRTGQSVVAFSTLPCLDHETSLRNRADKLTKLAGARRHRRTGGLNRIGVRNTDTDYSLGAQSEHLCKSAVLLEDCRRSATDRENESVIFAAEIPSLSWSPCCVDVRDFADPPNRLTFSKSIPRKAFRGRSTVTNKPNAGLQETAEDRDSALRHQDHGAPFRPGPELSNSAIRGLSSGRRVEPVPTSEEVYCDLLQTTLFDIVLPNALSW